MGELRINPVFGDPQLQITAMREQKLPCRYNLAQQIAHGAQRLNREWNDPQLFLQVELIRAAELDPVGVDTFKGMFFFGLDFAALLLPVRTRIDVIGQ